MAKKASELRYVYVNDNVPNRGDANVSWVIEEVYGIYYQLRQGRVVITVPMSHCTEPVAIWNEE